jgi:hypothetical protein
VAVIGQGGKGEQDGESCGKPLLASLAPVSPSAIQLSRNGSRKCRWEIEMDDRTVRMALERHWDASDASDFKAEHEIYREDAVLDYPQSGERIRGRHNIQESRFVQPNKKRLRSGELSAAATSGSLNSYLPMTAYHLTR